jgi:hypothetical protein
VAANGYLVSLALLDGRVEWEQIIISGTREMNVSPWAENSFLVQYFLLEGRQVLAVGSGGSCTLLDAVSQEVIWYRPWDGSKGGWGASTITVVGI